MISPLATSRAGEEPINVAWFYSPLKLMQKLQVINKILPKQKAQWLSNRPALQHLET